MFMRYLLFINQLPFLFFPYSLHFCLTVQHCAVWRAIIVSQHVVVMVKGTVQNKLDSHKKASLRDTVTGLWTWELGHNLCQTRVVTCTLNLQENQNFFSKFILLFTTDENENNHYNTHDETVYITLAIHTFNSTRNGTESIFQCPVNCSGYMRATTAQGFEQSSTV